MVEVEDENTLQTAPQAASKPSWLKSRLIPILMLVLVIALAVGIFYFWRVYPDKVEQLKGLGYLGVFIISLALNATVILPAGNFAAMGALATTLPPVGFLGLNLPAPLMVGIIGGIAAGFGESTGYLAGYSGQAVAPGKRKLYERLECWLKRWGMLFIFVFSAAPLVFDLVGLAVGALRYPYWKFLAACSLGRILLYIVMSYATVYGLETINRLLG
ncbi:MAG: VTT domain-containing protein [Dehalococcoidia bacterium]|nr:VTT domain-containing protein [Dehalococcoidia bacterium]